MDIVVIGSCAIDLISYVPYFPKPGETLVTQKFSSAFGGKGANQCVASSRLGAKTGMVAKVGSDSFGTEARENLRENHVDTSCVTVTDNARTALASISVNETTGENSIVVYSGANEFLSEDDVRNAEKLISSSKLVICQLECNPNLSLAALKMAKKHGVLTVLNPAPAIENLATEFYELSDFFCPNETEAEILCGFPLVDMTEEIRAIGLFHERGCRTVIITLGKRGALLSTRVNCKPVYITCEPVQAIDTVGAGDSFIGSLAFFLVNHPELDLKEVVRRSCLIASVTVTKHGTQTSFPWKHELPANLFSS